MATDKKETSDPFKQPFSLKRTFGKRWKTQMEESWAYEKAENKMKVGMSKYLLPVAASSVSSRTSPQ